MTGADVSSTGSIYGKNIHSKENKLRAYCIDRSKSVLFVIALLYFMQTLSPLIDW